MNNLITSQKEAVFLLGLILGFLILFFFQPTDSKNQKFEELALGNENTPFFAENNGHKIHCQDFFDIANCLKDIYQIDKNNDIYLWLGNSQLHAINQYKSGQNSASLKLHKKLIKNNKYLITFSQPNANLQEHYVLFSYLVNKFNIEKLILPVVFDDMREDEIRQSLKGVFTDKETEELLSKSDFGKRIINFYRHEYSSTNNDYVSIQENSENFLESFFSSNFKLWEDRPILRGQLFNFLYQFRNWLFNINPTSTRKMILPRYKKNFEALLSILDLAKSKHIEPILYIAPIRSDLKLPYNLNEYNSFKKELFSLSTKHNFELHNLESLIPPEYWGTKDATSIKKKKEIDFMHFQESGHKVLANKIFKVLN